MTAWRRAAALGLAGVLVGSPAYAASRAVPSQRLFSFTDPMIFESSGLVDRGDVVYTNNDSGDDAVVYGVDAATGDTISRTRYAGSVTDVEAIAPGARGSLWAGDIGDNQHRRHDIAVYRMVPLDGDHPGVRYTLTYPDGPHDAETLLVRPHHKRRVFVVTKSVFGGTVYAAPRHLVPGTHPNRLRPVAEVRGLVTDGTFFPDGKHVLLRTYSSASVYTFPAFGLVGTVRLPSQPQGEGISVGTNGRVLVSSEGVHSDVLRVELPTALTTPSARAVSGPLALPPSTRPASAGTRAGPPGRGPLDWAGIILVGAAIAGGAYITVRGPRVGGPGG
ncbi:MAG: hypothetical protein QOF53_2391 [Nocardioidaceae bacterium]|nr:hypothetical protein [Nocardioidaceae bacterium]